MSNRLAGEKSPYLQQHAENPVDWYPWGNEAFERARREDKPILLSVGYSSCHWCHVMAHESFENEETARLMNQLYVNVKVDREERPDVDSVYMGAVQAMTGSGGWPMTVFLTPDGRPFYGGSYFPPEDRYGMPGLPTVLRAVAEAYRQRRGDVEETARKVVEALSGETRWEGGGGSLREGWLAEGFANLRETFDGTEGGFGPAPKFPHPSALEFLLRYFRRSRDAAALDMVRLTLTKMARGGIYDQLGGGFHRYSTDARWLVPHFEKMLYDNALLSQVYLHAHLVTGEAFYRGIAEETLDYLVREMRDADGGFYSSQDADSEGVEGKYYLWSADEVSRVVGEGAYPAVSRFFGVSSRGNFEGENVLHVAVDGPPDEVVKEAKAALLHRRERRVWPKRDEKIISGWNGLVVTALAEAGCALGRQDYVSAAERCGSFLLDAMYKDGRLEHSYKGGASGIGGFLQDYAAAVSGLLSLHEATLAGRWLKAALPLTDSALEQFWDEGKGVFYDTGLVHGSLFTRPGSLIDAPVPSGGSMMTRALLRLASLTAHSRYREVAERSLERVGGSASLNPLGLANWLNALDFHLSDRVEIAIVGRRHEPSTSELLHAVCSSWLPNGIIVGLDPDDPEAVRDLPVLEGKGLSDGRATAYVCRGRACFAPVTGVGRLREQIGQLQHD
ncbi:MAG: thioredoxin domain-containing protein [Chloroflexota bacterium]